MAEHLSSKVINYASILEDNTKEQAIISGTMPFIFPHIALMPDAHLGIGATVGSVIPTQGAIMPAAIGVDIGCGMGALRTNLTVSDIEGLDLKELRQEIERYIPLSPGRYNSKVHQDAEPYVERLEDEISRIGVYPDDFAKNWRLQLGSLGGGNHFIEICRDEEDRIWIFLHSGSRGVGNKMAQKFIKEAQELCEKRFIDLPHKDLAYFVEDDPQFDEYRRHLHWAQEFAYMNRELMMKRVRRALENWYGKPVEETELILCHHNYTTKEKHFSKEVWVSRKGAIDAHEGKMGLIPGSMGTHSYVVRGKGNHVALHSAPHGAGRQHSRSQARKLFDLEDLKARMEGIEWREDKAFIDEIPDAYKPIDQVMEDSADLVEIVHELSQLINIKGQ